MSDQETALAVTSDRQCFGSDFQDEMREIISMNRSLLPLAQKYKNVAPCLFVSEFAKKSKEYLDQIKALWTSLSSRRDKPFVQRGASASVAANMGITINEILKAANWSSLPEILL